MNGEPIKSLYRRYKLKSVAGKPDDYLSLQETLSRRFAGLVSTKAPLKSEQKVEKAPTVVRAPSSSRSSSYSRKKRSNEDRVPDLILIDGGKGQLKAAEEIVNQLKNSTTVISLAKRNEEVFMVDFTDI